MDEEKVYTQLAIDIELAETVWDLVDFLEHADDVEAVGIYLDKKEDGQIVVGFGRYEPGVKMAATPKGEMVAAMAVNPVQEQSTPIEDPGLRKAMRFMYFYQAIYSTIEKHTLGL